LSSLLNRKGDFYSLAKNFLIEKTIICDYKDFFDFRRQNEMIENRICENCGSKHNCCEEKVYKQMGSVKVPSVVGKVVLAFLLPMVFFIVSIAASERIFEGIISNRDVRTFACFIISVSLTLLLVLFIRYLRSRIGRFRFRDFDGSN